MMMMMMMVIMMILSLMSSFLLFTLEIRAPFELTPGDFFHVWFLLSLNNQVSLRRTRILEEPRSNLIACSRFQKRNNLKKVQFPYLLETNQPNQRINFRSVLSREYLGQ